MIRDREALARTRTHETALACVEAGIEAALPGRVVRQRVTVDGDALAVDGTTYDLGDYDRVVVLGGGKPAARVATALAALLGDRLDGGVVVTAEGTGAAPGDGTEDEEGDETASVAPVDVVEAGHPVPDERALAGARRVLDLAAAADEVFGRPAFDSLSDVDGRVDVVRIFRPSDEVAGIVDEALAREDVRAVWMQPGIRDDEAAERAERAGVTAVSGHCMGVEYRRLVGDSMRQG